MSAGMHAPGPWSVEPYGNGDSLVVHHDRDNRVCFMATPGSKSDWDLIKANARLIAAAPDHALIAWAVCVAGGAWLPFVSRAPTSKGEFCFMAMRYVTEFGVPAMTDALRVAIVGAKGRWA